jgi:hypothetical protein
MVLGVIFVRPVPIEQTEGVLQPLLPALSASEGIHGLKLLHSPEFRLFAVVVICRK